MQIGRSRTGEGVRQADPYADGGVIDARAPRFNQAVVATLSFVALTTGWWWLLALLAFQLVVGLVWGRRFCLPCVFYFEVVQPRMGEGEIEDSRPPRFANVVGAVFLSAAAAAYATGLRTAGAVLAALVALLASVAASTGLCVGCEVYRTLARVRGIAGRGVERFDLEDIGAPVTDRTVVQFTHPLCTECRALAERLVEEGHDVVVIDVSKRSDLARRYGIAVVPTAVAVGRNGEIVRRIA